MKRSRWVAILLSLTVLASIELVFVPTVALLASPPNVSLMTCLSTTSSNPTTPQCSLSASYYRGGGSLTYCFLGEGALYLRGVYYPLTQPSASPAREIGSAYCPAMHR